MAESFHSFKELLVKKNLSITDATPVRYDVLTRIFLHVSPKVVQSNIRHFSAADSKAILAVFNLEDVKNRSEKLSLGEFESLIREALKTVGDHAKTLLVELLEDEVRKAEAENRKIEALARKYQPKDPADELNQLKERIKDLQKDMIEIEMGLMTLEKEELQHSEMYKKKKDVRERRKLLIGKLEKQKQALEKKLASEK